MGGTEHEPSVRTVQNQTTPFRAYMWIHERVVSQQARWTAGAASSGQGIPRAGGVRRATKNWSRVIHESRRTYARSSRLDLGTRPSTKLFEYRPYIDQACTSACTSSLGVSSIAQEYLIKEVARSRDHIPIDYENRSVDA